MSLSGLSFDSNCFELLSCLAINHVETGRCRSDPVDYISVGDLEKRPGQGVVNTSQKLQFNFGLSRGLNSKATIAREEVRDSRSNHGSQVL